MLVDDEADILQILMWGLQKYGCKVDAFSDPTKALEGFKPDTYGIILLDIRMQPMSGFELARKIWEIEPSARICFLSAFEIYESEARKVFPNLHSFCFLTKPIRIEALVKHIESHVAKSSFTNS